ncbi:MAG: tRNA adenosine deaminase-associated protein [Candidatus Nanopelagicales bacterium]
MNDEALDFALAAWREEGRWSVSSMPPRVAEGLDTLVKALRQLPGEGGSLGFVSVADEFLLVIRVAGESVRLVLSDLNAAYDWPLAEQAADLLGIELPDDEDELDEPEPAGDVTLLADLGMDAAELDVLCSDPELFPDEQLASIASRLGFATEVERALA